MLPLPLHNGPVEIAYISSVRVRVTNNPWGAHPAIRFVMAPETHVPTVIGELISTQARDVRTAVRLALQAAFVNGISATCVVMEEEVVVGMVEILYWFSGSRMPVTMAMTFNIVSSNNLLVVLLPGGDTPAVVTSMSLERLEKAIPID